MTQYVITITDRSFISNLENIPAETSKVYLQQFALKTPVGSSEEYQLKVGRALATAVDSGIVERLGLERIQKFSHTIEDARKFEAEPVKVTYEIMMRFMDPQPHSLHIERLEDNL